MSIPVFRSRLKAGILLGLTLLCTGCVGAPHWTVHAKHPTPAQIRAVLRANPAPALMPASVR